VRTKRREDRKAGPSPPGRALGRSQTLLRRLQGREGKNNAEVAKSNVGRGEPCTSKPSNRRTRRSSRGPRTYNAKSPRATIMRRKQIREVNPQNQCGPLGPLVKRGDKQPCRKQELQGAAILPNISHVKRSIGELRRRYFAQKEFSSGGQLLRKELKRSHGHAPPPKQIAGGRGNA